jgi:hypothetical protein
VNHGNLTLWQEKYKLARGHDMKRLVCEMCGGTDLVKQDGLYACQSCGTKYSTEEAKKMMVEGTIEVTGTVKVDNTASVQNFIAMAQSSIFGGNGKEAYEYANKALEIDSELSEAWLLKMKAVVCLGITINLRIAEILTYGDNAIKFAIALKKEEVKSDVYIFYLKLAYEIIHASIIHIQDPTAILKLKHRALKDIVATRNSDIETRKIFDKLCINAILLKTNIDKNEIAKNETYQKLTVAIAEEFVAYNKAEADRMAIYFEHLSNNSVAERRGIIKTLNQGLPAEKMISEDRIIQKGRKTFCYIATAIYGSYDCPEVWTLRRYRDNVLAKTWYGSAFIHAYYALSPFFVKRFGNVLWLRKLLKKWLDAIIASLRHAGTENKPYFDENSTG